MEVTLQQSEMEKSEIKEAEDKKHEGVKKALKDIKARLFIEQENVKAQNKELSLYQTEKQKKEVELHQIKANCTNQIAQIKLLQQI